MNNRPLPFNRMDALLVATVCVVLFLVCGARP